jgi:hypothetical protein
MARKYKLRFGDGTTLALDEEGLRTWVSRGKVDDKTSVQSPGSKSWQPLQEFMASEGGGKPTRRASGGDPPVSGPSLQFKANDDGPPPDEELYDGEEGYSPLSVAWLWFKRLVFTCLIIIGLAAAAATWKEWLPPVTQFGLVVFRAVDRLVHPPSATAATAEQDRAVASREGLQSATEQLPHLDAATVQRVMDASMVGVIDPPEVFRRSQEAIARGLPSLSREELEEVRTLRAALMGALPAGDRERLREYDRTRAARMTMPFEDREALALTARGARALPPAQRQRLQTLWAKAVMAGLGSR